VNHESTKSTPTKSHTRDDKLITDGNYGLLRPDPKRFCGDCNSLVACTSSKASARAWRSDIGTRELNNASEISSAVRYQRCRLNARVVDWEISLSAAHTVAVG